MARGLRHRTPRATHQCAGCKLWFTPSGLPQHILQTKKATCAPLREALYVSDEDLETDGSSTPPVLDASESLASGSRLGSPHPPPSAPSSDRRDDEPTPGHPATSPTPFNGDYFGDYEPGYWDDYDEYEGPADEGGEEELVEGDGLDADGEVGLDDGFDSGEEDTQEADHFEEELGWEPPPPPHASEPTGGLGEDIDGTASHDNEQQRAAQRRTHDHLRARTHVVRFPGVHAGAPINKQPMSSEYERYQEVIDSDGVNPYAPFRSRMDWEIARWAKMRGPGSTALTELLEIEELVTLLGLSFRNSRELNEIIDKKLSSGRPRFTRRELIVAGEAFEVFYRDVLQCIRALYGDPEFTGILVFTPERHYADPDHTIRVYFDMHTGRWWWDTQKEIEKRKPGATIIPVILSSDKTQLTLFGSKTAYPVYLTIGNLPKDVRRKSSRRGQILLAYLPASRLEHITSKTVRRRVVANLFHACMTMILKPLVKAGIHGIAIASGDGVVRRGHPIVAMYVGDYLEQLMVTCCKNGTCPKCDIPREEVGNTTDTERPLRDLEKILDALEAINESPTAFARACRSVGIKPVRHPFWENLPYVDIFRSITPDILHQLYQGVIKHVLSWLKQAYGPEELDARCRRLPPNHHIRLFLKGVTTLQKVTGKEHADICRFLLGLVIGLPLPDGVSPVRLVRSVRAILDFLYVARYPAHTSDSLVLLRNALERFHANKDVFIDLGIRENFHLPKLHSLDHYLNSIKLFGTTDNYDTQYTERLHIDFAKDAYRATNRRDEYFQMTDWLERREKILRHEAYIKWRLERIAQLDAAQLQHQDSRASPTLQALSSRPSSSYSNGLMSTARTQIKLAKWPNVKALRMGAAINDYGATYLRDALARFIVSYRDPSLTDAEIEHESLNVLHQFNTFPVFHRVKFVLGDAQQLGIMESVKDAVHARPSRRDRRGRHVPARFDTVLVQEPNTAAGTQAGIHSYRVGRVRLIFKLPRSVLQQVMPDVVAPGPLAYVEWFTAFTQPNPVHGLYKVSRCRDANGALRASVVEVRHFRRSCHLYPIAPGNGFVPRDWSSSTVLDACDHFFVNPFSDLHMYMTMF
ncbi:hypothetical protein C8Q76DRAFT_630995 [Earliella scabrosa]|nr:hypothetical protein C8Q76DRAFT_630995 [Earliella scabrosa]